MKEQSRTFTAQKMKFSIIPLRIWSHLLKKSLMKNFIFCAVFDSEVNWIHVMSCIN